MCRVSSAFKRSPEKGEGVEDVKMEEVRNMRHRRGQEKCQASEMPKESKSGNVRASEEPVEERASKANK